MISAVILTHNNREDIQQTISSLSWCDEIICVDDSSTDDTVVVAKKLGARVYNRALNNDFASQRNFGLEKAKGNWVLFVDSDEIVTEQLKEEIIQRTKYDLQGEKNEINGYFIKRTDVFLDRELHYGETANVCLLRLGKKHAGRWVRPVHEYWDIAGPTAVLEHKLLHYSHTNVAQFIDAVNRYSTINAMYFYSQGVRASAWSIIVYPCAKWIQNYMLRRGFLDGTRGFIMASMMSFHSFLTRGKLYQEEQKRA